MSVADTVPGPRRLSPTERFTGLGNESSESLDTRRHYRTFADLTGRRLIPAFSRWLSRPNRAYAVTADAGDFRRV